MKYPIACCVWKSCFQKYLEKIEGRNEGRNEGQALLSALLTKLFALNREEDVRPAVADEEARKRFYEEFGLTLAD